MANWTIALYSTNSNIAIDENSLADFTALGTTDPMEDEDWLKIEVIGVSAKKEKDEDIAKRTGNIGVNQGRRIYSFSIQCVDFIFPDDMQTLDDLMELLDRRNIFLYKGTYVFPETGWELHPDSKALSIVGVGRIEDDYSNGVKRLTINCRTTYPLPKAI